MATNTRIVTLKNWFLNKIWYPKTVTKAVWHKKADGTEVRLDNHIAEMEGATSAINADLAKLVKHKSVSVDVSVTTANGYSIGYYGSGAITSDLPQNIVDVTPQYTYLLGNYNALGITSITSFSDTRINVNVNGATSGTYQVICNVTYLDM